METLLSLIDVLDEEGRPVLTDETLPGREQHAIWCAALVSLNAAAAQSRG